METKESSIIKEINRLRMNLEATNRRTNILEKQIQEKERHCEKLESEAVNLWKYYDNINKWVKESKSLENIVNEKLMCICEIEGL